jgi:hypothetical protein
LCATESLVELNDMLGAKGICIGKDQSVGNLRALTWADQSNGVLASSPIFLNDVSQFVFGAK